ncbi:MAG: ABC transporter permease [Nocardioidaceae bacterium]
MPGAQWRVFLARRLVAFVLLLLIISIGIFSLIHAAPGSAEQILLSGRRPPTPERVEAIQARYHLNEPFLEQYGYWMSRAVRLDFGQSIRTGESVTVALRDRSELTLFLGAYAFIITMSIGVPLGVLAAVKKRTSIDRATVGLSVVGVSAPAFVTGIILLYVFAVALGWFPAFGAGEGFVDQLWHLALPAVALALTGLAPIIRYTRTGMLEALDQDYIVFASARGLSRARVLFAYGLRNALIPVVTAGGLILGVMLTGAVLVEVTFSLPGLGALLVDSVNFQDIPVVQALAMITAALVITVNLLTDILYVFIDPRIRFGKVAT